jgi:hypothetical protein
VPLMQGEAAKNDGSAVTGLEKVSGTNSAWKRELVPDTNGTAAGHVRS